MSAVLVTSPSVAPLCFRARWSSMPSCTSQSVRCASYRLERNDRMDGVTQTDCASYFQLTSIPRLPQRPSIIVSNAGSRSSATFRLRYLTTSCRGGNKTIVSHPLTTRGKKITTNGAFEEASTLSSGHSLDQGQGHGIKEKTNGGRGRRQMMGEKAPEPSPVKSLFSPGGETLTFQGTPPQKKPFAHTSGWEVLTVDAVSLRVKPKSMVMESAGGIMLVFESTLVPVVPSGGVGKAAPGQERESMLGEEGWEGAIGLEVLLGSQGDVPSGAQAVEDVPAVAILMVEDMPGVAHTSGAASVVGEELHDLPGVLDHSNSSPSNLNFLSGEEDLLVATSATKVPPVKIIQEAQAEPQISQIQPLPAPHLGNPPPSPPAGTVGAGLGIWNPSEPPQRVGLGLGMGLGVGVGMGEVSDEVEEILARVMEERVEEMERVFQEDLSSVQAMADAEMSVMRQKLEGKEALQNRLKASLLAIDVLKELATALMDEGKAKKNTHKASTR